MGADNEAKDQLINALLAHRLVAEQFPQWAHLSIRPVTVGGHDNQTYRLGRDKLLRFPSAKEYAAQIEKEQFWLPKLQPSLPLLIPQPIGLGKPAYGYPYPWSIYRWIRGNTAASVQILDSDKEQLAQTLGQFLSALQKINAKEGPVPGPHNFYRGGLLSIYDAEIHRACDLLKNKIDIESAAKIWQAGATTKWQRPPVWVHGDISAGNLLVRKNPLTGALELNAVIDFGMLAIGDPACDLAILWTFFEHKFRKTFCDALVLDDHTWARGRAWALWKAMIVTANLTETNAIEKAQSSRAITEIMEDYKRNG